MVVLLKHSLDLLQALTLVPVVPLARVDLRGPASRSGEDPRIVDHHGQVKGLHGVYKGLKGVTRVYKRLRDPDRTEWYHTLNSAKPIVPPPSVSTSPKILCTHLTWVRRQKHGRAPIRTETIKMFMFILYQNKPEKKQ